MRPLYHARLRRGLLRRRGPKKKLKKKDTVIDKLRDTWTLVAKGGEVFKANK